MKMSDEVGRQAKHVLMVKTKRKECVQAIQAQANATGVADITRVIYRQNGYVIKSVCMNTYLNNSQT
jgi:hypothetical protein